MTDNTDIENAIAIVGMSARFPGADSVEQFWENLRDSVESIENFSAEILLKRGATERMVQQSNYVRACAEPSDVDAFDAGFFGISPAEATMMDPQHRLFLECAWQAIESANIDLDRFNGRFGVFGGVSIATYMIHHLPLVQPNLLDQQNGNFSQNMFIGLGNDKSYACSRVAHKLNLTGPCVSIDAACATSMFAIHQACKSLLDFECDAAIAGGAKIGFPNGLGYLYEEGGMTSPDGKIYSFDAKANGTVFSSGIGVITLKRYEDAVADGDLIHSVILGSAINNDGADKMGFTAPSISGQCAAIIDAHTFADIQSDTISYVEAHGTGTPMGDPIEVSALTQAFGQSSNRKGFCALGALKPNVGHMEAAAGVAGVIKAVMALKHQQIPATLHFEHPNPQINFDDSPFYVVDKLTEWPSGDSPRRAAVSSFGVGGHNGHVVLQEHVDHRHSDPAGEYQLLLLSAKSEGALARNSENLAAHLNANTGINMSDVAYTLAQGRSQLNRRRVVVCRGADDAIAQLSGQGGAQMVGTSVGDASKTVFMFPGQGSQHQGMASALYRRGGVFTDTLDRVTALFLPHLGLDLLNLILPSDGAGNLLNETRYTQPALFAVEYALASQLMHWGIQPAAMIGHSIGEYVCACIAGVMSLEDGVKVIARRASLMFRAEPGDMLSVSLVADELQSYMVEEVDIAAVNAPQLSVVSGPAEAISAMAAKLLEADIPHQKLHTSHAFHSRMMTPILDDFAAALSTVEFKAPRIPFISNLSGDWITDAQATDKQYWVDHLRGCVMFADGVAKLKAQKNIVLMEVGPGQTLTQLTRKQNIDSSRVIPCQGKVMSDYNAERELFTAVGKLWLEKGNIDWDKFYLGQQRKKLSLPSYSFERTRFWMHPLAKSELISGSPFEEGRLALTDWFYSRQWQRFAVSGRSIVQQREDHGGEHWLVFADDSENHNEIIEALAEADMHILRVGRGQLMLDDLRALQINADNPEHYRLLFERLQATGKSINRCIHLWNFQREGQRDESSEEQLNSAFYSLLFLGQALSSWGHSLAIDVVSCGVHEVLGDETLQPARAALLGPYKTIPLEMSHLSCRHIDLDGKFRAADVKQLAAQLLLTENALANSAATVAIRNGYCWSDSIKRTPIEANEPPVLTDRGVYLITGGLGGVGLVFAKYLARRCKARLVLTGRQNMPPEDQWRALANDPDQPEALTGKMKSLLALQAAGAEVMVLAADVNDSEQVQQMLDRTLARFGQLNGVMHSAGTAGDGIMVLKTRAVADTVLRPKVIGTENLLSVFSPYFKNNDADFFILNSSTYSITSGVGQVDYCAANNVMNMLAVRARQQGVPVTAICWGPWLNIGMTAGNFLQSMGRDSLWLQEFDHFDHPLVPGWRHSDEGNVEFAVVISADHWVVDEHRIGGRPAVPGTALLDIIASAASRLQGGPVRLNNIHFLEPVFVDNNPRELLLKFSPYHAGWQLSLCDRADSAEANPSLLGQLSAAKKIPDTVDLEANRSLFNTRMLEFTDNPTSALPAQDAIVQLGNRWQSTQQVAVSNEGALCSFALNESLKADYDSFQWHPALLDLATGLVNIHWLDTLSSDKSAQYLPSGYNEICFYQRIAGRMYSINRLNPASTSEMLCIDINIYNEQGEPLVSVSGFRLAKVHRTPLPKENLEVDYESIGAEDGVKAFERVLSQPDLNPVMVSPEDLNRLIVLTDTVQSNDRDKLVLMERPDMTSAFAEPEGEMQKQMSDIWSALLGIQRIGIHDDFFELGGDSLIATKLVSAIRSDLGVEVALSTIFSNASIKALTEQIELANWAKTARNGSDNKGIRTEGIIESSVGVREEGAL
ncbi:SDR family NAD(P)-dependent oxidoreductase [Microbulbifer sp. 2304DJ12-6]|uniref:SDR family NAD(P)-dependent oxidoreductase n=1 Tax=Microbulbifer sp. 2304DJ12-6 TaxID=3233340 RepID=UPI0039B0B639